MERSIKRRIFSLSLSLSVCLSLSHTHTHTYTHTLQTRRISFVGHHPSPFDWTTNECSQRIEEENPIKSHEQNQSPEKHGCDTWKWVEISTSETSFQMFLTTSVTVRGLHFSFWPRRFDLRSTLPESSTLARELASIPVRF